MVNVALPSLFTVYFIPAAPEPDGLNDSEMMTSDVMTRDKVKFTPRICPPVLGLTTTPAALSLPMSRATRSPTSLKKHKCSVSRKPLAEGST